MPEAYIGESEYMRDTMEDWMLTANQTWYTERVMPWYKTDQIHLQWTEWENNVHYLGVTPHQAASNVVTQKRTIRRASMIRRGLAAEFENDFVATALGRTSFMASLAQIARAVQETANVEVLRALLGCHRYQQVYIRKHGIVRDGDLDGWWNRKAERFMIAQKEDFGLEILNTQIEKEQEQYQAQANVWILGREVMDYCSLVPEGKIFFNLGGQQAVDRINGRSSLGGNAAGGTMGNVHSLEPTRMIADTPVYLAKSYVVDSIGSADLLSRTMECGVFNTMFDRTRDYREYKSESRNIRVYDNDIDDWAEISLEQAIQNCVLFDDDGDVRDSFKGGRTGRGFASITDDAPEADADFLRFGEKSQGVRQDVKYIGDLDVRWMSAADVQHAGQTLYNALKRSGVDIDTLTIAGGGYQTNPIRPLPNDPTAPASAFTTAEKTAFKLRAFTTVINAAKNMLGDDSVFFVTPNAPNEAAHAARLYRLFYPVGAGAAAAYAEAQLITSAAPIGAPVDAEDKHTIFLQQKLGSVVPATHQQQLAAIVARRDQPWNERARAIESLLVDCHTQDPSSISALSSETRIRQWVANRITAYAEKFDQWKATQQHTAQPQQGAATTIQVPIGQPLPAGYRWANEQEAAKARGGAGSAAQKAFPTSLRDFDFLPHLFEGAEVQANIGAHGGRRRGIASSLIGATTENRGPETAAVTATRILARYNNLDKRIAAIAAGSAPLIIKILSIFYLGARFQRQRFLSFASNDIYVPANFLLMRPHATYRTRYGIKCATGGKSGYMFFGNSNMQIEHEAARKVGMMHYTAYLSAVVMYPKNVYVVQDLFCEKYLGGMGTSFWSVQEYKNNAANRRRKSIICTMLPPSGYDRIDKKIDIRGRWYTEQTMSLVEPERFATICYPGAARTAAAMGWWDPIRKGKGADQSSRSRNIAVNYCCFQGVQWHYNSKSQSWCDVIIEQGNFGPKVYPGCGQVRNGNYKYLQTPAYLGATSNSRF